MTPKTDVPTKQRFVVWAPDYSDPDALQRRLDVLSPHTEGIKRLVPEGFIS